MPGWAVSWACDLRRYFLSGRWKKSGVLYEEQRPPRNCGRRNLRRPRAATENKKQKGLAKATLILVISYTC